MNQSPTPRDQAPEPLPQTALEARFSLTVGHGATLFSLEAELRLERGLLVLFGPSGAGKSLTLAALAGHIHPRDGHINLGGQVLFDAATGINTPARSRQIGLVPQHNSLFPFQDVRGNVTFGLPRRRRRGRDEAVEALMDEVGIAHLASSDPASLSGGERQRVALARALAIQPRLLLLDEPFASIDEDGRRALQDVVEGILERHGIPAVFVTHDVDEARRMGQQVVLFERGRTTAQGRPNEVLGASRRLTLTGRLDGTEPATSSEGLPDNDGQLRGTAHLSSATVTGPASMLSVDEDGRICIEAEITVRD